VIATETEDVTGRLLDLTDGAGVNVVFDPVAGPGLAALLAGTAQYATVIIYGALSAGPTELPLLSLLQKRLTIRGYDMVEVVVADDTRLARAVAFINAGIESGALTPVIDTVFPVSEITDAYAYLEAKSQFGKVVVTAPDPPIPTRPQPAPRRPRPSAVHAWPACADYQTRTGRQIPILLVARLAPPILTSPERMGLSCRGRSPCRQPTQGGTKRDGELRPRSAGSRQDRGPRPPGHRHPDRPRR
jgi:hypothetical protein